VFTWNNRPTGDGSARYRRLGRTGLIAIAVALAVVGASLVAIIVSLVSPKVSSCATAPTPVSPPSQVTESYDRQVLSFSPVLYLPLSDPAAKSGADMSGNGRTATYLPADSTFSQTALPNGDPASVFNGQGQYAEVPSSRALSITDTGCLTVEAWVKATVKQFPQDEGTGYVYILGKGMPSEYEYALRMYSYTNTESPPRPNRVSAYVFNLDGGLGSGAYFQDTNVVGNWMMVTLVVDAQATSGWSHGYVALYKNGVQRGKVSLSQFSVKPEAASAPFRIATRSLHSYFEGAIGKVAVYDSALPQSDIAATYKAMLSSGW
jgi:hypothetical protein